MVVAVGKFKRLVRDWPPVTTINVISFEITCIHIERCIEAETNVEFRDKACQRCARARVILVHEKTLFFFVWVT